MFESPHPFGRVNICFIHVAPLPLPVAKASCTPTFVWATYAVTGQDVSAGSDSDSNYTGEAAGEKEGRREASYKTCTRSRHCPISLNLFWCSEAGTDHSCYCSALSPAFVKLLCVSTFYRKVTNKIQAVPLAFHALFTPLFTIFVLHTRVRAHVLYKLLFLRLMKEALLPMKCLCHNKSVSGKRATRLFSFFLSLSFGISCPGLAGLLSRTMANWIVPKGKAE